MKRSAGRISRVRLGAITWIGSALWLSALGGCTSWNPFGPGFEDGSAGWSHGYRPTTANTLKLGVDGRSREIENNLGVK